MTKANFGIIGCGNISNFHINALKNLNQNIIGIYDIDKKKGRDLSKILKCTFYKNLDDLLKDNEINAVIISTPNHTHYPIVIKAIKNKKNIFCEKPMTTNAQNSYTVYKKVQQNKIIFQVGYMRRHNPAFIELKNILSNEIKKIYSVNISLFTFSEIYNLKKISFWSQDPLKSGGYFLPHSGSHMIDIMRFLFSDPLSVFSKIYYLKEGIDIATNAIFEYKDFNVFFNIGILPSPALLNSKTYWEEKIEIIGKEGRVVLKNFTWTGEIKLKLKCVVKDKNLVRTFSGKIQWVNQMKSFLNSIKTKKEPSPNAYDGYMVDLIIEKLKESNFRKEKIKIK